MRKDGLLARLIICFFGLCSMALGQNASPTNAELLVGLWGAEQVLAPMVSGELTIDARTSDWRAAIGVYR